MFDIGWSELIVIGVVALVVIGPKELPGVIRSVGRAVTKLRTMAGEFRGQFDEAMREAELHDVKKTFTDMGEAASSAASVITNPVGTVLNEVKSAAAGTTGVTEANQALQSIQADALALEAELKQQASPEAMPETPPPETAKP
jgi:sec-independent protein translocase protein TatB